jgi:hypothetical protein
MNSSITKFGRSFENELDYYKIQPVIENEAGINRSVAIVAAYLIYTNRNITVSSALRLCGGDSSNTFYWYLTTWYTMVQNNHVLPHRRFFNTTIKTNENMTNSLYPNQSDKKVNNTKKENDGLFSTKKMNSHSNILS